ncbi:hypothetical protein [Streptomyces sp. NPDC055085]
MPHDADSFDTRLKRVRAKGEAAPTRRIQEQAIATFTADLTKWYLSQNKPVSLAAIKKTDMYGATIRTLVRSPDLPGARRTSPGSREAAALQDAIIRALEEANENSAAALTDVINTCEMHIARLQNALTLFKQLSQQDFLKSGPTWSAYGTQRTVIVENVKILLKLREKIEDSIRQLKVATRKPTNRNMTTDRYIEDLSKAGQSASQSFKKIGKELGLVTLRTSDGLSKVKHDIYEQALEAYVRCHPTENLKTLERVGKFTEFSTGMLALAPPGAGWFLKLLELFGRSAVYSAREGTIAREGRKRAAAERYGEVFDQFTADPLLMATAYAERAQKNISLLMTWLGAPASVVGGGLIWQVISKLIRETCYSYCTRRIEAAREDLARIQPNPAQQQKVAFKAKAELILKATAEDVAKDIEGQIESGKLIVGVVQTITSEQISESFAAQLAGAIVRPVVDLIMQCLPVEPAQIITGENLADWTAATRTVMSIPQQFIALTVPNQAAPGTRRQIQPSEIFDCSDIQRAYGWTLIDSDALRSDRGDQGEERQHLCFSSPLGFGIWADVGRQAADPDSDQVWSTEEPVRLLKIGRLVFRESEEWAKRTIAADGYSAQGAKTHGSWCYIPVKHVYAFLPQDGANPEFVRGITATKLGTVDSIFHGNLSSKLKLYFWDLGPTLPGASPAGSPKPAQPAVSTVAHAAVPDTQHKYAVGAGAPGVDSEAHTKQKSGRDDAFIGQEHAAAHGEASLPKVGDIVGNGLRVSKVNGSEYPISVEVSVGFAYQWLISAVIDKEGEIVLRYPLEDSLQDKLWINRTVTSLGYVNYAEKEQGEPVTGLVWRNPFKSAGTEFLALTSLGGSVRSMIRASAVTKSGWTVKGELERLGVKIYDGGSLISG